MNEPSQPTNSTPEAESTAGEGRRQLNAMQRRILGVLIEKARTTPDAYPLSLNALVTGANQKSNRHPVMQLTAEQVDDQLIEMRNLGLVAEVHGGGRVPKYRHYGYDFLGVKGAEAGVMAELLLRGEQTLGDLRSRASRFDPIDDLDALKQILDSLEQRGLVIALTPKSRGQIYTHNLYLPDELEKLRAKVAVAGASYFEEHDANASSSSKPSSSSAALAHDVASLRTEVSELRALISDLSERITNLDR